MSVVFLKVISRKSIPDEAIIASVDKGYTFEENSKALSA